MTSSSLKLSGAPNCLAKAPPLPAPEILRNEHFFKTRSEGKIDMSLVISWTRIEQLLGPVLSGQYAQCRL